MLSNIYVVAAVTVGVDHEQSLTSSLLGHHGASKDAALELRNTFEVTHISKA